MSVESTLARVGVLQQALLDPSALLTASRAGGVAAPAPPTEEAGEGATGSFAQTLQSASAGLAQPAGYPTQLAGSATPGGYSSMTGAPPTSALAGASPYATGLAPYGAPPLGGTAGSRVAAIAESQVGQSEQPPGSNEGPAIANYRTATAGAAPGEPWCAYFASWAARQAGTPLGPNGEGLGSTSAIWSWAQGSGRAIPNGPGVTPQPGDLIVFGSTHVGIVKDVLPDGQVQTIEGNYSDKVSENVRSAGEATGYVRLG
ncbi:MAG TPA: CHAP domain-containing protein [Solirubrobacteraceae bacterium]|nr:CHAP domain-containing protein [Solirubrobacteraceae bacterium]